jgi:hypothetical protein
MMRADYDSRGDTVAIAWQAVDRLDHGNDEIAGAVVGFLADRPVCIDILSARRCGVEEPLRAAATRYGLDSEALLAAARAALAAPDRVVTLDVDVRAVA